MLFAFGYGPAQNFALTIDRHRHDAVHHAAAVADADGTLVRPHRPTVLPV
jgi:hypothetical protein